MYTGETAPSVRLRLRLLLVPLLVVEGGLAAQNSPSSLGLSKKVMGERSSLPRLIVKTDSKTGGRRERGEGKRDRREREGGERK